MIDGWGISCEIAIIWMSLGCTDDQSTLVQVMAWCRQATSHYLSQCWPRSLSPYGATRPQWVKDITPLLECFDHHTTACENNTLWWDTPLMCKPAYAIMMIADVLAPNRCQAISNHNAATWTIYHGIHILSKQSNKLCLRKVRRLATHWFLCYWWDNLFIRITLHVISSVFNPLRPSDAYMRQ